ncbi:hypothetical protein WJX72_011984 [[Myrmecia] bisecta]|uniref:Thioredoxin domain-containing protein n=1 Tax=[Myrmecia] bisecta TaxID=41462 RepID=A0AAW1QGK4_9CHLO
MAQSQVPLQYHLQTDQELEGKLTEKALKVVEVFAEWCGPCKSVLPTLKRIRLEKDDESTLQFLTVCAEKCQFLDAAKQQRGKSEPLFLLYRNGILKQKVEGANTPLLSTLITQLTPITAESDDILENPLYLGMVERKKAAERA